MEEQEIVISNLDDNSVVNDKTIQMPQKNYSTWFLGIMQIIIAIITLFIAIFSFLVAQKTYEYASLDFSIIPQIYKENNILAIKNTDKETFKIQSIVVEGYDNWYISNGGLWYSSVYLQTSNYTFNNINNKTIDLNDVKVDLRGRMTMNNVSLLSSEQQKTFEDAYDINMAALRTQYSISYHDFTYRIGIQYLNTKSYRTNNISLQISLDDDGNIQDISFPEFDSKNFDLIHSYANFKDEWNRFVDYVDKQVK